MMWEKARICSEINTNQFFGGTLKEVMAPTILLPIGWGVRGAGIIMLDRFFSMSVGIQILFSYIR